MKTKLLLLFLLAFSLTLKAQTYSFTLIQNSLYNYSVAAVPDFDGDVSNPPNLESFGFTIMLEDGASVDNVVFSYLSMDSKAVFTATQLDAADPGQNRSATIITSVSGDADLPAHSSGDIIVLVTFDVLGSPSSGEISILDNNSALATYPGVGGIFNSFMSADVTGGFNPTQVYAGQTGTTSYSFNTLGINDELLAQGLRFYPNPVRSELTVDSQIPLTKVEIYNVLGKMAKEVTSKFEHISLDNLSNGIYIVRLYSEDGVTTKKLIKE